MTGPQFSTAAPKCACRFASWDSTHSHSGSEGSLMSLATGLM